MTIIQHTLEGGVAVAGLTPIQRQLDTIMRNEPETRTDEDLLRVRWFQRFGRRDVAYVREETLLYILHTDRSLNFRERRREMAKMGLWPWPAEERERRQKRGRQGAPGGAR